MYLQQGYNKVMNAIEISGLLPALKRQNEDYMFFIENDIHTSLDSSLIFNPITGKFSAFLLYPGGFQQSALTVNDIRTLLLNHVAIDKARKNVRKEFIPNLAGNIIIVNNVTGEISGTAPTTVGYRGSEVAPEFPVELSFASDNGTTYDIKTGLALPVLPYIIKYQPISPGFMLCSEKPACPLTRNSGTLLLPTMIFILFLCPAMQRLMKPVLMHCP